MSMKKNQYACFFANTLDTFLCPATIATYLPPRYGNKKLSDKIMLKDDKKKKILTGFRKASTLLSKVTAMVENDHYCIDVMQQNLAVIGLLRSAHEALMENHLNTCFRSAMASKDERKKKQMTEEILKVTNLYNK